MRKIIILIVLIQLSYNGFSQTCDCYSNLKWVIETFEKNDAGFQYTINKKGEGYYSYFTKEHLRKSKNIENIFECQDLMNDWLLFFRKGHIGVSLNTQKITKTIETLYDTLNIKKEVFIDYLEKEQIHEFEGVWEIDSYYTVGIIADNSSKVKEKDYVRKYIGFILNSNTSSWSTNQIKLEIFKSQKDSSYMMKYYTGDHTLQRFSKVELIGNNYIKSGFILLEKSFPKEVKKVSELELKFLKNQFPFVYEISNNTMYLRIPSFHISQKELIDSLLIKYFNKITNHKNLIIDIRNNGGGSDLSYKNILPLLYTNPIRIVQVEYLSTKLNLKSILNIANNSTDPETNEFCETLAGTMKKNLNKFVSLNDDIVQETKFDTIYEYPKKIAILINNNNASSAEQFVYEARQSNKVKLFGTSTYGAIDISNMNNLVFVTDNRFTLWHSISKSYRIPYLIADDIGFPPDYYYDKTIKPYEWIDKTLEILNYE